MIKILCKYFIIQTGLTHLFKKIESNFKSSSVHSCPYCGSPESEVRTKNTMFFECGTQYYDSSAHIVKPLAQTNTCEYYEAMGGHDEYVKNARTELRNQLKLLKPKKKEIEND